MLITKMSPVTGVVHSMDIPVTQEQLNLWKNSRRLIQDVMPHLTADQREFLITGITSEEWKAVFADQE